jgi:ATP synthase F0 subunit c
VVPGRRLRDRARPWQHLLLPRHAALPRAERRPQYDDRDGADRGGNGADRRRHRQRAGTYFKEFLNPIHLVGELSRIVSLAARLFGNIFGGEVLLAVIIALTAAALGLFGIIPAIFYGLELFFGFIQALLFSLLTLIYITVAAAGHGGHGHADHDEADDYAHGENAPARGRSAISRPRARDRTSWKVRGAVELAEAAPWWCRRKYGEGVRVFLSTNRSRSHGCSRRRPPSGSAPSARGSASACRAGRDGGDRAQPEAEGAVRTTLIIGAGLAEAVAIYAFVIALILIFAA